MIKIRRGLDLPIAGAPGDSIEDGPSVRSVAVIGFDYHGMKPTMAVKVGDKVKLGQELFSDKKTDGVKYTAPASGTVSAINRGYQRALQSVVIDVEGDDAVEFKSYSADQLSSLSRDEVVSNLVESGMWTAIRTRPYSKVPAIDSAPAAVFVSAMDTNPLAANPQLVIAEKAESFKNGLDVLSTLAEKVFVCHKPGADIPKASSGKVTYETFDGVHPAGNVGTHIHYLAPVSAEKSVWTVGYQDVIAIGELFTSGKLYTDRVISLAGPQVEKPRLLRTRLGADLDQLTAGQMKAGENRVVSGSVFGGSTAAGPLAYLGRYDNQVVVLEEGRERPMLHYFTPGVNRFSKLPIYLSSLVGKAKKWNFTTSCNGSERAMVPIGAYESVMPLDILPTQLLRALIVGDTDVAQKLGCLELDEEDLALCTFVSVGKYEYGPILRDNLTRIEKEG